jgi:hypothetical protein
MPHGGHAALKNGAALPGFVHEHRIVRSGAVSEPPIARSVRKHARERRRLPDRQAHLDQSL